MKTLFLVRHAKSSWDNPSLSDFDRPLNKRGKHDAPFMGKLLKSKDIIPDFIVSSSAVRAVTTARHFAEAFEIPKNLIQLEENLYDAEIKDILTVIRGCDDQYNSLMLFGHNPGLTECANYLCQHPIDNIVTAGVYSIGFNVGTWKKVDHGNGTFRFYEYPKKYK